MPHIVIVGGGLAGMAAAARLADNIYRWRITLLESRPRLGGRASSFVDQTTGTTIDNCQHVNLGCCTNFQEFCRFTEIADGFRTESAITFVGPNQRLHQLSASFLPAPFHLLTSFARLSYLTWYDKWWLARGLRALAHRRCAGSTELMSNWLQRHRQTPDAISRVWQVVLVSALSESLDRITVHDARKVFVDAFLANREGWKLQVPIQPLDTLYTQRVGKFLRDYDIDVRLSTGVSRVIVEADRATGVQLRDGTTLAADQIILAVPSYLVKALLPDEISRHSQIAALDQLEWAPISSVHLWFDRRIMPLPHATLVDRLSQWIFSRGSVQQPNGTVAEYYQVVISASRQLAGREQSDIIREVVAELGAVWPTVNSATLLNSRVITEHKACLSMLPHNARHRPTSQSPIDNISLAGDWTATGWPSTMEGAVRSGNLAAESVSKKLGGGEDPLPPDLPVSWLSRALLGI